MAFEERLRSETYVAAADLRTSQYRFVKLDTNGKAIAVAAITDLPVGILQNKPNTNEAATVALAGVSKIEASAAHAINDLIGVSTNGRALSGPAAGNYIAGRAISSSGAAGEYLSVQFSTEGIPPKA